MCVCVDIYVYVSDGAKGGTFVNEHLYIVLYCVFK